MDGDVSEAVEYLHPEVVNGWGGRDEAIEELDDFAQEISSYDDIRSMKLSSSEISLLNKELDYDYKITAGSFLVKKIIFNMNK